MSTEHFWAGDEDDGVGAATCNLIFIINTFIPIKNKRIVNPVKATFVYVNDWDTFQQKCK